MRRTGSEEIGFNKHPPAGLAFRRVFVCRAAAGLGQFTFHQELHFISLVKARAEALDFKSEDAGPLLPGFPY